MLHKEKEFEKIYQENFNRVYSYFCRKKCNTQISLELTQETFLRVYTNMNQFRNECPMICWIYKIAHNLYCSTIRNENLQHNTIEIDRVIDFQQACVTSADCEDEVIKKQNEEIIMQTVNSLPEMIRKCIIFHYYHELSYKEITDLLNISINTVKTHIKEGLKKLRQAGFFESLIDNMETNISHKN